MFDFLQRHWKSFLRRCVGQFSVPLMLVLTQRPAGKWITPLSPPPTITPIPVRGHTTGAVNAPGGHQLPKASIVHDATDTADGQQLFILEPPPTLPPTPTASPGTLTLTPELVTPTSANQPRAPSSQQPVADGRLTSINAPTPTELEFLPHIGPAIVQRIIEYRTANRPWTSIEQIVHIKGIKPATFNAIKDSIIVT